jgi:hypothetical protein
MFSLLDDARTKKPRRRDRTGLVFRIGNYLSL